MFSNLSFSILCLLYLLNYTVQAASAVIGIDLGTEYIKATLVKPGIPLEIVLTKDSRRKELSAIAFKPEKNIKKGQFPERVFGSDAINLASRFPGDVYPNLKTLLGLGRDNPIVNEYALRHPKLKVVADSIRGTAAFRSEALSLDQYPWTVEEILAMELQNIQKNAQALAGTGSKIKDVVFTIPTFYTVEEKRAILLAADLAELHVLELISDGLAVGINYATTRKFPSINEGGKPETNLIFDMGAGSTKASILRFQGRTVKDVGKFNKTIQEVKLLASGWDRTLGGDLLNCVIVDDIIAKFIASPAANKVSINSEAIKSNGKTAAKLLKEAEKIRQVLSANANTQAFFEELYENIDFKYKITRVEFEKLTEIHAARISATIQKSLNAAGLTTKDLDSIILHGGASRTPFVQKEIEKFIGDTSKLKTNVNSDESAVFGAGFRGATLSPSFRVKEIRVSDSMTYASGIKWKNVQNKLQRQGLWQAKSFVGDEKRYTFKNQEDPFVLTFYQRVPSLESIESDLTDQEILAIKTTNLTNSVKYLKEKYGCPQTEITVRLNAHFSAESGEVEISKLVVGCEAEISEEKESMVDSVKGLLGFGKKDQIPLSESETVDSPTSTSKTIEGASSTPMTESVSTSTKQASKEEKVKPHKILRIIPLDYTIRTKPGPQLPESEISRMKERLAAFSSSENYRRLREETLNQLEGFTYKIRDFLDDTEFITASTVQERIDLETKSKDTSDWIYSGGSEASREELKQKLQELKNLVSPIEFRKVENLNRPEKIIGLQSALNETQQLILSVTEQIAIDKKKHAELESSNTVQASKKTVTPLAEDVVNSEEEKPTMTESASISLPTIEPPVYTDSDLVTPKKLHEEYSAWLEAMLTKQEQLKENDDPVLLSKDLEGRTKMLQETNVQLLIKNMRRNYQNQYSDKKNKKYVPQDTTSKVSKSVSDSGSKTIDKPGATFTVGSGGQMPSEEEILKQIKKFDSEQKATKSDDSEKKEKKASPEHNEL